MERTILQQLTETTTYIKTKYADELSVGIVLGSGLGDFIKNLEIELEIPYNNLPHFPISTVKGHDSKLFFGKIHGRSVVVMAGRFHHYEGYEPQQVVYPIRVMKLLGAKTLLISNAAGGVNASFKVGDLMIIKDHISLFVVNPLRGNNEDELGTRFPDMSEPYSKELITKAKLIGHRLGYEIKEGVYTGVTGPSFETRAEYKLIKAIGGDAVGMSTVQEVIAAAHAGMKVFAMSIITNIGIREIENTITHEEVLAEASAAGYKLAAVFKEMVREV